MKHILRLEDDDALRRGIGMAIEGAECTVTEAALFRQAGELLGTQKFDLLILDINLPDGSGLELLRTLRGRGDATPAILLTANDLELDEVTGLEAGADDYITQPFSLAGLRARVNTQLRRVAIRNADRLELGPFSFDFARMAFRRNARQGGLAQK